jgi:hypothetical protein
MLGTGQLQAISQAWSGHQAIDQRYHRILVAVRAAPDVG